MDMKKIIDTKELVGRTRFILSDGGVIEAEYGYQIGNEVGIHNRYNTRTLCKLYENIGDSEEDNPSDTIGFACSLDDTDGDYDWGIWESELFARLKQVGWIEQDLKGDKLWQFMGILN
jgi:hypothetical protein